MRHGISLFPPLGSARRRGGDHGFRCHQRAALTLRASCSEMAGCSAVDVEASALAFLIDALLFGLFRGCGEVHGGQAEVGQVTGDVGGR